MAPNAINPQPKAGRETGRNRPSPGRGLIAPRVRPSRGLYGSFASASVRVRPSASRSITLIISDKAPFSVFQGDLPNGLVQADAIWTRLGRAEERSRPNFPLNLNHTEDCANAGCRGVQSAHSKSPFQRLPTPSNGFQPTPNRQADQ
jgi:hypothetical protein